MPDNQGEKVNRILGRLRDWKTTVLENLWNRLQCYMWLKDSYTREAANEKILEILITKD